MGLLAQGVLSTYPAVWASFSLSGAAVLKEMPAQPEAWFFCGPFRCTLALLGLPFCGHKKAPQASRDPGSKTAWLLLPSYSPQAPNRCTFLGNLGKSLGFFWMGWRPGLAWVHGTSSEIEVPW